MKALLEQEIKKVTNRIQLLTASETDQKQRKILVNILRDLQKEYQKFI